jgi:hypothetical protein
LINVLLRIRRRRPLNRIYKISSIVGLAFLLVSCAPSVSQVQTAIALTQAALPTLTATNTTKLTSTITPTKQPTNTDLPKTDKTIDAIVHTNLDDLLENLEDVYAVTTVRPGNESLEIELRTRWVSRDNQPDVSYEAIRLLANVFGSASEDLDLMFVSGNPEHFSILLTTYSVDGKYKYSSLTYYDTLVKIYNKQITYEEWVNEANAGFVK